LFGNRRFYERRDKRGFGGGASELLAHEKRI
jgi:hypothetical protein